ncbi:MAG: YdcF family protein [Bacteroidetes bacterium]|nr:YdcF family protein [Bacteroidota bacterium]
MMKKQMIAFLIAAALLMTGSCNVRKIAQRMTNQYMPMAPYDVVIVPGIAYDTARQLTSGFNARIIWAKKLYDQGITKNIIFSGSACYSPYVEGQAMKLIAEAMGVPAEHVFAETKAEHGKENVYYGYLLAQKLGFKKVALAADPYQAFFLEGFIETNLPDMGILPMAVDSLKKWYLPVPAIDASPAFVKDFIPLNKRESFATRVKHTNHNNLPDLPKE